MTELQLYKYINDNNIEYNFAENNGVEDVLIFPMHYEVQEFTKMIDYHLENNVVSAILKGSYLCIWMKDICEAHDIEMSNIFKRD